jgi:hypothetical protein
MEGGTRRGTIVITKAQGGSGRIYTYKDMQNQVVRVERHRGRYLDTTFPIEHRGYDDEGRLNVVSFTDSAGSLISGPDGFARRRSAYSTADRGGLLLSFSYFDAADSPMRLTAGYFREEDLYRGEKLKRVRYFDLDGDRVAITIDDVPGVHEIQYAYLMGTTPITMETFVDESGTPIVKRQLSGHTRSRHSTTKYYRDSRGCCGSSNYR